MNGETEKKGAASADPALHPATPAARHPTTGTSPQQALAPNEWGDGKERCCLCRPRSPPRYTRRVLRRPSYKMSDLDRSTSCVLIYEIPPGQTCRRYAPTGPGECPRLCHGRRRRFLADL